jgi:hypothetical protein
MDQKEKDFWDKISSFSTIFSTAVLGGITLIATQWYQWNQAKNDESMKRVELLENLMPYLTSTDSIESKAAILVLSSLQHDSLAAELATRINTVGTRSAIHEIYVDSSGMDSSRHKWYKEHWENMQKHKPVQIDTAEIKLEHYSQEDRNKAAARVKPIPSPKRYP